MASHLVHSTTAPRSTAQHGWWLLWCISMAVGEQHTVDHVQEDQQHDTQEDTSMAGLHPVACLEGSAVQVGPRHPYTTSMMSSRACHSTSTSYLGVDG